MRNAKFAGLRDDKDSRKVIKAHRSRREGSQPPNIWINNVEVIAAARISAETVNYLSNIYRYYVAYKLIAVQEERRRNARESFQGPS